MFHLFGIGNNCKKYSYLQRFDDIRNGISKHIRNATIEWQSQKIVRGILPIEKVTILNGF